MRVPVKRCSILKMDVRNDAAHQQALADAQRREENARHNEEVMRRGEALRAPLSGDSDGVNPPSAAEVASADGVP